MITKAQLDSLTFQETEILRLFQKGLSNLEIADSQGLTIHTIKKYHMPNIYRKLGFYSDIEKIKANQKQKGKKLLHALSKVKV
jgi:DNA-binding NarL/FixJ family response regulator